MTLLLPSWAEAEAEDIDAENSFEFIVVTDTHFLDDQCTKWFRPVIEAMKKSAPKAVFCIVAGDVTDRGTPEACGAMRDLFAQLEIPVHIVPGNHDYLSDADRSGYDRIFPDQLNYHFEHQGWQFVGLDSTQGTQFINTLIPNETLDWLTCEIPKLDPARPTFAFTHFPLGEGVEMRPRNADEMVALLQKLSLRWVHSGHWHGSSLKAVGQTRLMTSRCCARIRGNADGSRLKGWHVYRASADGTLTRRFAAVPQL
ncbi:MAG: metallophosphoesterase [Chthoniobacteraceae bacterium]